MLFHMVNRGFRQRISGHSEKRIYLSSAKQNYRTKKQYPSTRWTSIEHSRNFTYILKLKINTMNGIMHGIVQPHGSLTSPAHLVDTVTILWSALLYMEKRVGFWPTWIESGTTKTSTYRENTRWRWLCIKLGFFLRKLLEKCFHSSSYPILIFHGLSKFICTLLYLEL